MRRPGRGLRTLCLVVSLGAAACATLPGGGAAENAGELERRADELRQENARLAAGRASAATALIAIEQRLTQTRAELVSFQARAAEVRAQRRAVRRELGVVRSSLRAAHRALAARLQGLYEEGEADTLAMILGSGSLAEALEAMEAIDLAATQDENLIERARSASSRLVSLSRRLEARERELEQLAAARAAAAASLADARARRLQTIASLRSASHANSASIVSLERRARALASARAPAPTQIAPTPAVAPGAPAAAADGARALTVVATAYALRGVTASGSPVGWGAVAVDPSVIPMGSRLSVPGYGLGVAADTGSAIQGPRIDLWFPTVAQARAWGTRVVTVTIYSN